MPRRRARPHLSKRGLLYFNVELRKENPMTLCCLWCQEEWCPGVLEDGRWRPLSWRCPKGCNQRFRNMFAWKGETNDGRQGS